MYLHSIIIVLFIFWQIQLSDITAVVSIISGIVLAVSALTGVVFVVWRSKNYEQCKEDVAREKAKNAELKEEAETAKKKKIEAFEEKARAEKIMTDIELRLSDTEAQLNRSIKREIEYKDMLDKYK